MSKETAIVLVDYPMPGRYYAKDTEWIIDPNEHDPGVLAAKSGAKPVTEIKKE